MLIACLLALYPLRFYMRWLVRPVGRSISLMLPCTIDPAPLLYPPVITILVAAITLRDTPAMLLPNLVLGVASLPKQLIPSGSSVEMQSLVHWMVSVTPVLLTASSKSHLSGDSVSELWETTMLVPPLHDALCGILHYLTTTSLLPAELQLLSVALINLLLLAKSPQALILKALLWVGGVGILVTCAPVLRWGLVLARVPKWRFRRELGPPRLSDMILTKSQTCDSSLASTDFGEDDGIEVMTKRNGSTSHTQHDHVVSHNNPRPTRRSTLPASNDRQTSTGRKRRRPSATFQPYLSLTYPQAVVRKWMYAVHVYACIVLIAAIGVRTHIGTFALAGHEPIGWAIGYVLGDLPRVRMHVITTQLERWISLPQRGQHEQEQMGVLGWMPYTRQVLIGEATTRLLLSAYWVGIIAVGLTIVLRLSSIYEVDTRRKVFHFMMVAMFLPATYIDPAYTALALSLALAIFLLLDLLRASQLPPVSKYLARFLTPYVDGRDLKGPVVISHIFLLIGCAIPLWLTLGSLPRTGDGTFAGWEVPTREVSMVSGVICVGMGDAAASLIGRRYGRHKWFWSGGKSLEGSVAFTAAVTVALLAAKAWLRIGGWQANNQDSSLETFTKASISAAVASLTEAVLTGGNDNVVVPVILWLCVKGLEL